MSNDPKVAKPRVKSKRPHIKRLEAVERAQFAKDVGQRIALVRILAELTQAEMARLVEAGSQPSYARWESGTNIADVFAMLRFAARLRVSLDYIYRGLLDGVHPQLAEAILAHKAQNPDFPLSTKSTDWRKGIRTALSKVPT